VVKRDPKDPTTITALKLNEISLVDRPCNPEASINMWKVAADEPAPAVDPAAALLKAVADLQAEFDDVKKDRRERETEDLLKFWPAGEPVTLETMVKVVRERAELIERLDKILAEPMPAKCAASGFVMLDKVDDAKGVVSTPAPNVEDVAKVIAAMPQEDRALLLMRAALSNPIPITR
jgi:hypothetical protein